MKTNSFYFNLPEELIAQVPSGKRENSRLLVLNSKTGEIEHKKITDFAEFIPPETLLVMNNSRVRKARIYGYSAAGGRVEFLLVEKLDGNRWKTIASKSKKQKPGKEYTFDGNLTGVIIHSEGMFKVIEFNSDVNDDYLDKFGHIPLPPYIKREDTKHDAERYQTVFSEVTGSIAAPTAGLHFTQDIIDKLHERQIKTAHVTLHVGLGTFLPIRSENLEQHEMHTEEYEVPEETIRLVTEAKKEGRKVLAVGTTSVRTLESAWNGYGLTAGRGKTNLFIYPGFKFQVVDKMLTNFHTPESSLLVLVSAFAGKALIDKAYASAVKEKYRFYSYGDAMLII